MPVATRLLIAGGSSGSGFTLPAQTIPVLAAPNGGWTQTQGPQGVGHAGYTYVTYVDGTSGALEVGALNDSTLAPITPIQVHAALTSDTHDAGALLVRASDNRLMVWYSGHDGAQMYQRVSVNSLDSDPTLSGGFAAETTLDASLGGTAYTYPFPGQFDDGTLWLAFRDDGAEFYLCLAKSTDDGATWTAETKFAAVTGAVSAYQMVHYGADRIDVAISNGNGVTGTHISLYHAYFQGGGNFHKSDGSSVSGSQPWNPSAGTLVHDGSAYPNAWASGMGVDGTAAPVILYETLDTANGHAYTIKYARYSGGSWTATTITTLDDTGLALIAHSALSDDGTTAYVVKAVSGKWEVFRYSTADHGATWIEEQLTSGSSSTGNVYPTVVRNPGLVKALVMSGTYVATDNFNVGITGIR